MDILGDFAVVVEAEHSVVTQEAAVFNDSMAAEIAQVASYAVAQAPCGLVIVAENCL